jgi:hypothetical protein
MRSAPSLRACCPKPRRGDIFVETVPMTVASSVGAAYLMAEILPNCFYKQKFDFSPLLTSGVTRLSDG